MLFAALSTFHLTEGLVKEYPPGSFLAPVRPHQAPDGRPSMSHILMMPLNAVTDEVYTVHYELET
jgi:hypothetical protein